MINIVHARDLVNFSEFVRDNKEEIDVIKIDTSWLIAELDELGVLNQGTINDSIMANKIGAKLFNNRCVKSRAPISSPELMSELGGYLASNELNGSWIVAAYYSDILIFIEDVDTCNYLFGSSFINEAPLLSSEIDWRIYNKLSSISDIFHYTRDFFYSGDVKLDLDEYVKLGFCHGNHSFLCEGDMLPENENKIKNLYDEIINE